MSGSGNGNSSGNSSNSWKKLDNGSWIHSTAIVESWVELGRNCIVQPYAIVGRLPSSSKALARRPLAIRSLKIGDNVDIGSHAIIFGGVEIGSNTLIGDHAHIREETVIGSNCMIGRYVCISYQCKIGDECRFQDRTVFTGITGKGCFFGVGVITSNDKRIDTKNYKYTGADLPIFGDRVMVGSGANILAGVRIGNDAVIGAGALVVDDVPTEAKVLGKKAVVFNAIETEVEAKIETETQC